MVSVLFLLSIGLLGAVGLGGGITGLVGQPPRARQGALLALGAAVTAVLMGLIGTIVGLVRAFDAVAKVEAARKSEALAEGISLAMRATALGLVVGVVVGVLGVVALVRVGRRSEAQGP